ncbi:MAG: hypothetical protein WC584_00605 [Candidatus Pacearchaeota archaeon]
MLRILPLLIDFAVIFLIGIRTLKTACFNAVDINLSIGALIFSVIVEMMLIKRK